MSLLACSALLFTAFPQDLPSGPNVGDKLPEMKVHGFSGPHADKEFGVVETSKNGPTLLIIVHKITRPALQLMRPIDDFAAKETKLATNFVWLGEKDEKLKFLDRAKNSLNLQSPQGVALDKDGPATYGLNADVAMTILLAKDNKVVANFAFTDPNGTDAPKVVKAVAKLLGKEPPKTEEKKEEAKKGDVNPELQKLMRRMIQKDNDEATVGRVVAAMEKWAGQDKDRVRQLRDYARRVVRLGYGNEIAQTALKKLAERE